MVVFDWICEDLEKRFVPDIDITSDELKPLAARKIVKKIIRDLLDSGVIARVFPHVNEKNDGSSLPFDVSFGFELELEVTGHGWDKLENWEFDPRDDGSIDYCWEVACNDGVGGFGEHACECEDTEGDCCGWNLQEFSSPVYRIYSEESADYVFNKWDKIFGELSSHWGSEYHANNYMGFHVHFADSVKFMSMPHVVLKETQSLFLKLFKKLFPTMWQLRKNNTYCVPEILEEKYALGAVVARLDVGSRYRAINFAALSKHGTIEVRIPTLKFGPEPAYYTLTFIVLFVFKLIKWYFDLIAKDGDWLKITADADDLQIGGVEIGDGGEPVLVVEITDENDSDPDDVFSSTTTINEEDEENDWERDEEDGAIVIVDIV